MQITDELFYIGSFDKELDLFEGQYPIKDGVSYNSYVLMDERVAVLDTVDASFVDEWLGKIEKTLAERKPDYLIVHHMEPDHSAGIKRFLEKYEGATVIASQAAFRMMRGFFGTEFEGRRRIVTEGDTLSLGKHSLSFITAPMVHWPEVIMSYDAYDKTLFSADAFGKFGTHELGAAWVDEARRYYFGIVGKYGKQVQAVLTKLQGVDVRRICSLHGPVIDENLGFYIDLYSKWSSYTPEDKGVTIAYASIYGNTSEAAILLRDELLARGEKVALLDLARCEKYEAVAAAFKYDRLVLAASTYNAGVFPPMRELLSELRERGYKNRKVALIENGSWAPVAAKTMRQLLGEDVSYLDRVVKIASSVSDGTRSEIKILCEELINLK